MPNHDEEKERWELGQCQFVAAEMNRQRGTDYEAQPIAKSFVANGMIW